MSSLQQVWEPTVTLPPLVSSADGPLWFAIHTRFQHEKKVAAQLENKHVSTFLPLVARRHRWSDREMKVQLPLFPCYIFVRLESFAKERLPILRTLGVIGFVGIRGVGLPIPNKEIEDIQTLLTHNTTCALHPFLRTGQRVRICGGCLEGIEGILLSKNCDRRLIVSIELIQRSVAVQIDGYDVEPI